MVMDSSREVRLRTAAVLQIARLATALQMADTLQLLSVLADAAVDPGELAAVRGRGCPSLGWALSEIRRSRSTAAAQAPLPLNRLSATVLEVVTGGDGAVSVRVRIQDEASARRDFADSSLEFEVRGSALILRRTVALHAAFCGLALARSQP